MGGLVRNLIVLLKALLRPGLPQEGQPVSLWFLVTPFDTGISTFKSDRYLMLAECAQLDWLVRTGVAGRLLRQRCSFVNAAQMVKFDKPIRLFQRVRIETSVVHEDGKCAWFSHAFSVGGIPHAHVLVKMKFKQGRRTVAPAQFVPTASGPQPQALRQWDEALASLR
ncbi:MAG: thioesterase family protein, partial [Burkholderiaceae bacterium]